jgi:tryptophanase
MENNKTCSRVKFFSGKEIPLEMHKVRVVQKLNLLPIEERKKAIEEAGFNTFLLQNRDVFLDMLTDSGTNAMSDNQKGAMMVADDSYAGSASYAKLEKAVNDVFNQKYFLPVHQGRAAEHIISQAFVTAGKIVVTNYHFTTTKAHIELAGGKVYELYADEALKNLKRSSFQRKHRH